jgi:hypothetical protein
MNRLEPLLVTKGVGRLHPASSHSNLSGKGGSRQEETKSSPSGTRNGEYFLRSSKEKKKYAPETYLVDFK